MRRSICAALAVAAFSSVALHGGLASADPPTATETSGDQADRLYREGKEAVGAGKMDEGYRKFREAFALKQSYDIAGNLGAVELALGKNRDAAEHLSYSLRNFPVNYEPERRKATQDKLTQAKAHVGAVAITVTAGAEVFADEHTVGKAPLEHDLYLDPGHHVLSARLPGYEDGHSELDVAAGSSQSAHLTLEPKQAGGVNWAVAGTGLGLGTAGVVAAIALRVAANGKGTHADELGAGLGRSACVVPAAGNAAACSELLDTLQSQDSLANAALGTGIAGGGLLAASVIYMAVAAAGRSGADAAFLPEPWFGTDRVGLGLAGRF